MKENLNNFVKLSLFVVALFFGVNYISAWTPPAEAPPSGNVPPPINVGPSLQSKSGILQAGTLISSSRSSINTTPDANVKLTIGSETDTSYLGFKNSSSGNKMWQVYPRGNDLILFENNTTYGSNGVDRITFKAKDETDTTGNTGHSIFAGKVASQRGLASNANLSNNFYDLAFRNIGAGESIYSYGKICTGNSLGGCDGTGGVVLDGFANFSPRIKSPNGPVQVGNNATPCDSNNIGAIRYVDGNPGELAFCKRTGASTYAWTAIGGTGSGTLPTCSEGQVLKWSGGAWGCASDVGTSGTTVSGSIGTSCPVDNKVHPTHPSPTLYPTSYAGNPAFTFVITKPLRESVNMGIRMTSVRGYPSYAEESDAIFQCQNGAFVLKAYFEQTAISGGEE